MSSVDVGICHDDDLVVAELVEIEILTNIASESRDHVLDLFGAEDSVESCLLNVEDLTSERQNCLALSVTSLLCGAARGITLYKEDLAECRILFGAVCELARKRGCLEHRSLTRDLTRLACGFTRTLCLEALVDDDSRLLRVLLEEICQLLCCVGLYEALDLGVTEFGLRLTLELRICQLD